MSDKHYLLDTDILSDLCRRPTGAVYHRISLVGASAVCTSVIVACELRYGAARNGSARLVETIEGILARIDIEPFGPDADASIRFDLEGIGQPIGPNDLLIAAHARSLGLTVVTHNTNEFGRVQGLHVEDWLS